MRKFIGQIHLWIGFLTGLVVFVVCITGCMYAYQKELILLFYTDAKVEKKGDKLPVSQLVEHYQKSHPNENVSRIYDFKSPTRSSIIMVMNQKKRSWRMDYVNPYTGEFLFSRFGERDVLFFILKIHRTLTMGRVGKYIVGWSIFGFLISLLTGFVLWFPKKLKVFKSKQGRLSRFGIKSGTSLKRKIYDLHNVLGFYSGLFLLIISITGLCWSFRWFDGIVTKAITLEAKKKRQKPPKLETPTALNLTSLDVIDEINPIYKEDMGLRVFFMPRDSTSMAQLTFYEDEGMYGRTNTFYIHPETGDVLDQKLHSDKNTRQKIRGYFFDMHTGSIWGLLGKTLAFLASLIGASLPITGVWIYINRKSKKKKKRKPKAKS